LNMPDVNISMLSDEDFDEEECEDLRLQAQNESFERYTVVSYSFFLFPGGAVVDDNTKH